MSSRDDSLSASSMVMGSQTSLEELPTTLEREQSTGTFENDQDESELIDDEDDQEDEVQTSTLPTNNPTPLARQTSSFHLHELLESDLTDVFLYTSTEFLAGASYELNNEDSTLINITFHFFTNFIETETACQWQICNKKPLTCQLTAHSQFYVDQKVLVKRVYQTCPCHPANSTKVPFIERLVRDYFEKVSVNMETLKLSRASNNQELRAKYFLELIPDKSKRSQYEEMLLNADDQSLIDTLLEYEILECNEKLSKKFSLLKPPRENASSTPIHYDLRDPKNLPKLNHGYLVQFCRYIEYRLKNLNSLCVMCGKRTFEAHDKKAAKPTICDDYECFSNAMDSKFRNDPLPPSIFSIEIADFLLLLVHAAIHSNRHGLILDPYPKLINPYNTSTTLLDEHGNKTENIETLKTIIDSLMSMGSITKYEVVKVSLRSMIEIKHPWGFSFFHWLMGTNRYHFSFIPQNYHIKSVYTKYQYFIKHEDIVKHVNFKKLREEKGSILAFHGSPQENWHSILRSGLQVGKGGYLLNGAAYGEGIYVSPSLEFSASYARSHRMYQSLNSDYSSNSQSEIATLQNRHWSCIALCEIINSPDVYKKHTGDIWTIKDPNLICTRFIFFFPTGAQSTQMRVDSETEAKPIRELIHTLSNIAC